MLETGKNNNGAGFVFGHPHFGQYSSRYRKSWYRASQHCVDRPSNSTSQKHWRNFSHRGAMVLQAIKYTPAGASPASLEILDQLALPHRSIYLPIVSSEDAWDAIKQMKVRGAPAIAIVAALSLAVELSCERTRENTGTRASRAKQLIWKKLEYLKSSRPTAVNLGDAAGKLKAISDNEAMRDGATADTVATAYITAAEKMLVDDVKDNEAIGRHGASWIKGNTKAGRRKTRRDGELKVITHCNTGWVPRADHIRHLSLLLPG
jgi:methylthioribose-1-phosphate isomerase